MVDMVITNDKAIKGNKTGQKEAGGQEAISQEGIEEKGRQEESLQEAEAPGQTLGGESP